MMAKSSKPKLLTSVNISGRVYTIIIADEIDHGEAVGAVDPLTQQIAIVADLSPERAFEVLLHEVIHVLSDDAQLNLRERQVHALGVALADTLVRNDLARLPKIG